jgi:hypothetical protein
MGWSVPWTPKRWGWSLFRSAAVAEKWAIRLIIPLGLEMLVRIGDRVSRGTPLVKIFSEQPEAVIPSLRGAIQISETGTAPELIVERIGTLRGSK